MSEEEKKRRADYVLTRKKNISRRMTVLIAVLIIALISGILAGVFDKAYYVNYKEQSSVDYGAMLKGNDFYEGNFLGKDYAYVTTLIDKVYANFKYQLDMDSRRDIDFSYEYKVLAVVEIRVNGTDRILYATEDVLATNKGTIKSQSIKIGEEVRVDYAKYSDVAERFVNTYLSHSPATATLKIKMDVDVTSESHEFDQLKHANDYVAAISIPLLRESTEVSITSDAPATDGQILSYTTEPLAVAFTALAVVFGIAGLVLAVLLLLYINSTKNHDVTYESTISRLVTAYKSFIQKLTNHFDTESYRVLTLSTFDDMLAIRDTIQSPILMDENDDRTCTRFLIPTNNEILYVYEVKVGDYDDIYANIPLEVEASDAPEAAKEAPEVIEEIIVIPEEATTEPEEAPAPAIEPIEAEFAEIMPEAEQTEADVTEESVIIPAEESTEDIETEVEAEEIEETLEEQRLRYLIHADPDFSFVEPEAEPVVITLDAPVDINATEEEEEPTVITVDAPVDVKAGADSEPQKLAGIELEYNVSYNGSPILKGEETVGD